jgi:hypothetical protein
VWAGGGKAEGERIVGRAEKLWVRAELRSYVGPRESFVAGLLGFCVQGSPSVFGFVRGLLVVRVCYRPINIPG